MCWCAAGRARSGKRGARESPRTTSKSGVNHGGTSEIRTPASATARVDLRSASMEELHKLEDRLRECMNEAWSEVPLPYRAGDPKLRFAIELIGDRPAAELAPDARIDRKSVV